MAKPNRSIELLASHWSICGNRYASSPDEVSPFDFRERAEVAHRVGFCGMGLVHADLLSVSERIGYESMRRILADNEMKYVEVEVLFDWFADGERRRQSDLVRRDLLKAAEQLGARLIKIVGDVSESPAAWPMDHMIEDFRDLCSEAAEVGTSVGIELLPFSNLKTLEQGMRLVEGAGATNGGLILDIWHMERGAIRNDDIRRLPRSAILGAELNDARAEIEPPLYHDTVHNRVLPGEGSFDIAGFLKALRDAGYDGPYGVEILSREHRVLPLAEQASRAYQSTIQQFEAIA